MNEWKEGGVLLGIDSHSFVLFLRFWELDGPSYTPRFGFIS
jgi:hypothetical protein